MPIYGQLAVRHVWIVDPNTKTIEVLRNGGEHWLLLATDSDQDCMRAEPFDAIELELRHLWAW